MTEFLQTFLSTLAGATIAGSVLTWLLSKWLGARIEGSIRHEYDKRKADYENETKRRERAQLIADLMAEWMDSPVDGTMASEQRKRLNKLSFEATLWLPEDIARELSRVLQSDPTAPNMFELLLGVRTHLSGKHNLTVKDVTQWTRDKEQPNFGLPDGFVNGQLHVLEVSEEAAGQTTIITADQLKLGHRVKTGAAISFNLQKGDQVVKVSSPSVEAIRLIEKSVIDGVTSLTIQLHPKSLANDINRSLFGTPRSQS